MKPIDCVIEKAREVFSEEVAERCLVFLPDALGNHILEAERGLFDRVRVAVVSVRNCSIDLIFRERAISCHSGEYDPEVVERAVKLLEEDGADSILAFVQKHDDTLYRTSPFSEEALSAAMNNVLELLEVASASQPPRNRESRSLPMRKKRYAGSLMPSTAAEPGR